MGIHRARPAWARPASGSRSSRRIRIKPSSAMAITCSVDWAHRLASSPHQRDRLAAQEALEPVQHAGQPVGVVDSALEPEQQSCLGTVGPGRAGRPGARPWRSAPGADSGGAGSASCRVGPRSGAPVGHQVDAGFVGEDQPNGPACGRLLDPRPVLGDPAGDAVLVALQARRVGRCGVQSMARMRHTCPGW